ncbi:MAG: hypothetical protein BroJett011_42130 [Chloroflexota bacterium]|nr:MAG: hypothetical protein BroJett011_42130 [Chloroflexota bacterium]
MTPATSDILKAEGARQDIHTQLVQALLSYEPAPHELPVTTLLQDFLEAGIDPDWLALRAAEVEPILASTRQLVARNQGILACILNLKPTTSPYLPIGF